jgi:hypothetical protein
MALNTTPRLDDPDALFAALAEAHQDLDPEISRRLDAQLVLLLANHIGDTAVVREAIRISREVALEHSPAHRTGSAITPNAGGASDERRNER